MLGTLVLAVMSLLAVFVTGVVLRELGAPANRLVPVPVRMKPPTRR